MEKDNFYNFLSLVNTKLLFTNVNSDFSNVQEVYHNNLSVWYYNNSDNKSVPSEEFEPVNGIAKDPDKLVYSQTKEGFKLTESDFISEQLSDLQKIDSVNLTLTEKKQLEAYRAYLIEKDSGDETYLPNNPYPEIFTPKGYKLFERLYEENKDSKTLLAAFSFIYRSMYKDGYILEHVKPEVFKAWLSKEPYSIVLDQGLKTYDRCLTSQKKNAYSIAKELIQNQ